MEAIPLTQILSALFLSTIGLTCLYALISSIIFYSSLSSLKHEKIRNFIFILFITVLLGFLYATWNFLNAVKIIVIPEINKDVLNTLLITNILVLVIYLSFSARKLNQTKVNKKKAFSELMNTAVKKGSRMKF